MVAVHLGSSQLAKMSGANLEQPAAADQQVSD